MLRVTGKVGKFTETPWDFTDERGERRTGVARVARIIVGLCDFVDVKIPDAQPGPQLGADIDWTVVVRNGKVIRDGEWSSLAPAAPSPVHSVKTA